MIPAISFEDLKKKLNEQLPQKKVKEFDTFGLMLTGGSSIRNINVIRTQKTFITGLLFAPPNDQVAKDEILPNLDIYNFASSNFINFYCAGYGMYNPSSEYKSISTSVDDISSWQFSAKAFHEFINEIQHYTNWMYKGETELLLFDTQINSDGNFTFYTNTALCFDLSQMKRDKSIESIQKFFYKIFNFNKKLDSNQNCYRLSDNLGVLKGKEHILRKIGDFFKETKHFAIRDITKK